MIEDNELAHKVSNDAKIYTIDEALEHGELSFYLPVQWGGGAGDDGIGGPPVDDPLTIYASWDVSGADHRVTFKTTLYGLLVDTYELFTVDCRGDEGVLDEDGIEVFEQIRSGLLRELQRVNGWIEKARHEQTITPSDLHAEDV